MSFSIPCFQLWLHKVHLQAEPVSSERKQYMMHPHRFDRRMLIRLLVLFSAAGVFAAILPLPHFDSQARSVDSMTPLRQSLSGLYGSN